MKKNALQAQLVAKPQVTKKAERNPPDSFIRNIILAGEHISPEIVMQQAEALFDAKYGDKIKRLELRQQELDALVLTHSKRRAALEKKLSETPEYTETCIIEDTDHEEKN